MWYGKAPKNNLTISSMIWMKNIWIKYEFETTVYMLKIKNLKRNFIQKKQISITTYSPHRNTEEYHTIWPRLEEDFDSSCVQSFHEKGIYPRWSIHPYTKGKRGSSGDRTVKLIMESIKKHWHILQSDTSLREILKELPITSYQSTICPEFEKTQFWLFFKR